MHSGRAGSKDRTVMEKYGYCMLLHGVLTTDCR